MTDRQTGETKMTTATAQCAISETYEDVKGCIVATVRRYQRKYGGDWEELMAQANLIFTQAYYEWERANTELAFHTWISCNVFYQLLDDLRRNLRPCRHPGNDKWADSEALGNVASPDEDSPLASLAGDALTVASLAIDPPTDLAQAIQARGGQPRNVRACIRVYLQAQGWSTQRISAAFDGVRTAW